MSKKIDEDGWRLFLKLCSEGSREGVLPELLDLLLTLEEKRDLGLRCLIIKELELESKPQRGIAQYLQVSIVKITRGSNALKTINNKLREFIRRHMG